MHRPLKEYTQQLTEFERHPLFKESLNVSVLDFQDLGFQYFAAAISAGPKTPALPMLNIWKMGSASMSFCGASIRRGKDHPAVQSFLRHAETKSVKKLSLRYEDGRKWANTVI